MSATLARLVRQVRRRVDPCGDAGDCALLARWVDQADQNAFELLLWRHGPMVWQTCRRVLRHEQDAEDAFQAAFLALARKASSIRKTPSVAGWLYRVAHRAALAARSRRRPDLRDDLDEAAARPADDELRGCLDEELRRLPERYREAFVLCCLQGLSTDEAASALGCPRGTVGTRVAWARRKLRERLGREVPSAFAAAAVPAGLAESVFRTVAGDVPAPVAELCREVMTMLFVSKIKGAVTWVAPLLLVAVGIGGLSMTSAGDKPKPAEDKKKPAEKKPAEDRKPSGDKKPAAPADVQGVVKSVQNGGKQLTVVTKKKDKNTDEQTVELKLTDRTQVLFSGVGLGEAQVKEGYLVTAWLEDKSKDTAARATFSGDRQTKGAKPSLSGAIASVADDGKSFAVLVKKSKKNEDAVEQTVKITDKTDVTFSMVPAGGAKLTKGLTATVWLQEDSADRAARVSVGGDAEVPSTKKGGAEAPAHQGVVTAVDKDGKSVTISEAAKNKNEEPKTVVLKLDGGKQVFGGVAAGGARVQVGQHAAVWVKGDAKDTVAIGYFQALNKGKDTGIVGKVTAAADDGKCFTLLLPPTKKNEEGKEVTIKLGDKAQVIFNAVGPGAARITKGQMARVELADGSKDTAAAVTFGAAK